MSESDDEAKRFMRFVSLDKEPQRQAMLALRVELSELAKLTAPPTFDDVMLEQIAQNKRLGPQGFHSWPSDYAQAFIDRRTSIFQLYTWIRRWLVPGPEADIITKKFVTQVKLKSGEMPEFPRLYGSYQLKHIIERHRGIAALNGEVILASTIAGFPVYPLEDPNAEISIKTDSLDGVIKSMKHIGLPITLYDSPEAFWNSGATEIKRQMTWIDIEPPHLKK